MRSLRSLPSREAGFVEPMECLAVAKLRDGGDWVCEILCARFLTVAVPLLRVWVHCQRASNGLLPRRSNLLGYVRWDARSDRFLLARQSIQQLFRSQSALSHKPISLALSREAPRGSLPAFAPGNVVDGADATDIHSITEWHSLSPSSVIRTAISPSCDVLSPCGERCGFTLFRGNDTIG